MLYESKKEKMAKINQDYFYHHEKKKMDLIWESNNLCRYGCS